MGSNCARTIDRSTFPARSLTLRSFPYLRQTSLKMAGRCSLSVLPELNSTSLNRMENNCKVAEVRIQILSAWVHAQPYVWRAKRRRSHRQKHDAIAQCESGMLVARFYITPYVAGHRLQHKNSFTQPIQLYSWASVITVLLFSRS